MFLEDFKKVPPSAFFQLADRTTLERGLRLFAGSFILSLTRAKPNAGDVVAKLKYEKKFTVKLSSSNAKFKHQCNCKEHKHNGTCQHVCAVAAMVLYIAQGKNFYHKKPNETHIEKLKATLNGETIISPEKKEGAPAPELQLLKGPHGRPEVRLQGANAKLIQLFGMSPPSYISRKEIPGYSLNYIHPEDDLKRFIEIAKKEKMPFVYVDKDQTRIPIHPETVESKAIVRLKASTKEDIISYEQVPRDESPDKPALIFNPFTHLQKDGRICILETVPSCFYSKLINPFYNHDISGSIGFINRHNTTEISISKFNSRSLASPYPKIKELFPGLQLRVGDTPVSETVYRPADPSVEIYRDKDTANASLYKISFKADGVSLPLESVSERFVHDIEGWDFHDRLMANKARATELIKCALVMSLEPAKKVRTSQIRETLKHKAFENSNFAPLAKRWLKNIEKEWLENDDHGSLVYLPGSSAGWQFVESIKSRFLKLHLGLMSLVPGSIIPDSQLHRFMHHAAAVCGACDADLIYNGTSVESAAVEVTVDAEETGDIDWFELKAEVRCGEWTISPDEWDLLIRGELLLQRNGKVMLPDLSRAEAVHHLQQIYSTGPGSPKRKGSIDGIMASIPRLQILDWIALRNSGATVRLPAAAEKLFENLTQLDQVEATPLPPTVEASLRPYQQRGFDWIVFLFRSRFGACLADDMGLGKTLQAIAFLAWVESSRIKTKKRKPHLIVVPPSLLFNWTQEIERFCPTLSTAEYIGGNRQLASVLKANVVLTTYDMVRRDIEELRKHDFDVVIFDEAQILKNLHSQRTRAAVKLKRSFTLCLTGTPMENHVGEYYAIMNLALPGIFGDYKGFVKSVRDGKEHLLRRARPFILRRTKQLIAKELPDKVESDIYLEMSPEQKEIYTRTVAEVREEVRAAYADKPRAQAGIAALTALMRLRQVCISPELLGKPQKKPAPKLEFLVGKMTELMDEGHSALIFSQFTRTLDIIELIAKEANLPILRLDGSTPVSQRKALVRRFQESDTPQFFLISLKAGGVGLNLTRATYVFHADPWWNPAVENQASDRAHRIGQLQTVFIQRILMRHSIEEKMMLLKQRKQELFNEIIEDPGKSRNAETLITKDDFAYLLS